MTNSSWFKLIVSILGCELIGVIGSIFTTPGLDPWYSTLIKSPLTPPAWVFGPVWTTLFALMGIALFLIWQKGYTAQTKPAFLIFGLQLFLNLTWSIIFFGNQNPSLALINIILLWIAIAATIYYSAKINRITVYLLAPYLVWVSFALYLNYAIYSLN